jgi:hypothetical protein
MDEHLWAEVQKADAECQRNSCKRSECNGFLCRNAVDVAIMAATERAALTAETHMLGNKHVAAAIRQGSQPSNVIPHEGVVR